MLARVSTATAQPGKLDEVDKSHERFCFAGHEETKGHQRFVPINRPKNWQGHNHHSVEYGN